MLEEGSESGSKDSKVEKSSSASNECCKGCNYSYVVNSKYCARVHDNKNGNSTSPNPVSRPYFSVSNLPVDVGKPSNPSMGLPMSICRRNGNDESFTSSYTISSISSFHNNAPVNNRTPSDPNMGCPMSGVYANEKNDKNSTTIRILLLQKRRTSNFIS